MLRIVHPADHGQDPPRRKGSRSAALLLTEEEVRHLRTATRNVVRAYGGADVLASVLGVPVSTVHNVTGDKGQRPSGTLAIRIAKAAGMYVEALFSAQLSEAGRCSACGSRVGDKPERKVAS
jgi:hypothetical protein